MHRMHLGPDGPNFRKSLYKLIDERLRTGHIDSVLVLVPKQSTFDQEAQIMQANGYVGLMKVDITSFERIIESNTTGFFEMKKKPLSPSAKIVSVMSALSTLKGSLQLYEDVAGRSGFIESLISMFDSLGSELITPELLMEKSTNFEEELLRTKVEEISKIYAEYLSNLGLYVDELKKFEMFEKSLEFQGVYRNANFIVAGFNALNKRELTLLSALVKTGAQIDVFLPWEKENEVIYSAAYETIEKLQQIAQFEITLINQEADGMLPYANIPYSLVGRESLDLEGKSTFFKGKDPIEEMEYVAGHITRLIHEEGMQLSDIQIVAGDLDLYSRTIRSVMKRAGISVFMDEKKPVVNSHLAKSIISLISILSGRFNNTDVLRLLKFITPVEDMPRLDIFENRLIENAERIGSKMLPHYPESMEKVYRWKNHAKGKSEISIADFAALVYDMTKDFGFDKIVASGSISEESDYLTTQVWNIVIEILESMKEIYFNELYDFGVLSSIFALALRQHQAASIPAGRNSVQVTDLVRMVPSARKVTFFIGCMEDKFPRNFTSSGIFSDRETSTLYLAGIELGVVSSYMSSIESMNMLRTMALTSEGIFFSMCSQDLSSEYFKPSPYLTSVKFSPSISLMESVGYNRQLYEDRLTAMADLKNPGWKAALERLDTDVSQLGPEVKRRRLEVGMHKSYLSASRLDTYAKCPYKYFVDYLVRPHERKEGKVESADIGTFYHQGLSMYLDCLKSGENDRDKVISELEALESAQKFFRTGSSAFLVKRARKVLDRIFDQLEENIQSSTFKPSHSEAGFSFEIGEDTSIAGAIDRLDVMDSEECCYIDIYDYKTGTRKINLGKLVGGYDYQLMTYALAAESLEKTLGKRALPSGIFYYLVSDDFKESAYDKDKTSLEMLLVGDLEVIARHSSADIKPGKSNHLSRQAFDKLKGIIVENIENISRSISSGVFDISPLKDDILSCDYCSYSSLCRFEKGIEDNQIRRVVSPGSNTEIIEKLEGEEGEDGDQVESTAE